MKISVRVLIRYLLLVVTIFCSLSVQSASAYTMADVDSFMSSVQANPSQYGADFTNGDKIYKEQYTLDGMLGYKVFLDKNSIISKDPESVT